MFFTHRLFFSHFITFLFTRIFIYIIMYISSFHVSIFSYFSSVSWMSEKYVVAYFVFISLSSFLSRPPVGFNKHKCDDNGKYLSRFCVTVNNLKIHKLRRKRFVRWIPRRSGVIGRFSKYLLVRKRVSTACRLLKTWRGVVEQRRRRQRTDRSRQARNLTRSVPEDGATSYGNETIRFQNRVLVKSKLTSLIEISA